MVKKLVDLKHQYVYCACGCGERVLVSDRYFKPYCRLRAFRRKTKGNASVSKLTKTSES